MNKNLLDQLILIGGPPRSGSTFAAESLNSHPQVMAVIDDHRFECWTLYYYKTRLGLVTDIREGHPDPAGIRAKLKARILDEKESRLPGLAASEKTAPFPRSPLPQRPDGEPSAGMDEKLVRFDVPLDFFRDDMFLCMKSPEISFVLPQLIQALPEARFIIVYRPIIEIAESMFRKGNTVKLPIYHRRWQLEQDEKGELIPPPGVPVHWHDLWKSDTIPDFYRCLMYAASYMLALEKGIKKIPRQQVFVYDHSRLREHSGQIFEAMAQFLGVEAAGFAQAQQNLKERPPQIAGELQEEYKKIETQFDFSGIMARVVALDSLQ